jgi:integrase
MKGGIYSDERCPRCGKPFEDNEKDGLQCPNHPDQRASTFKVKFKGLCRRFSYYRDAKDLLEGWRWEERQGKFNAKEYKASNPLGFTKQTEKFLKAKKADLKLEGYRRYMYHYRTLSRFLGDIPVTQINYAVLEDLKSELVERYKPKTIYDTFGFLKTLLRWCIQRGELTELPDFPKLSKKMGMRRIFDKSTQAVVLDKVYEMYWERAPRACIGIELLCTYPKIRPAELRQVQEKHIDLRNNTIVIPSPKGQDDPKAVRLLDRHVELIRSLPRGFPEMYFLRYDYPVKGRKVGQRFGRDYLYHVWRRACSELGLEGVPLYPGTKHTTMSDWGRKFSESLIHKASGVVSNAMRRYLVLGEEDCITLYEDAAPKVKRSGAPRLCEKNADPVLTLKSGS